LGDGTPWGSVARSLGEDNAQWAREVSLKTGTDQLEVGQNLINQLDIWEDHNPGIAPPTDIYDDVAAMAVASAAAVSAISADNTRISSRQKEEYNPCQIGPYSKMRQICGPKYGMQAHHIVPDWTLRYGTRAESSKRIPNMLSLNGGMTMCIVGHATLQDTEHNIAHRADAAIEKASLNSDPPNTITLEQVKTISILAMIAVRTDCADEIFDAVNRQFSFKNTSSFLSPLEPINPLQLLRGKRLPPLHEETITALRTGATRKF
jgi:hypothetical protein